MKFFFHRKKKTFKYVFFGDQRCVLRDRIIDYKGALSEVLLNIDIAT